MVKNPKIGYWYNLKNRYGTMWVRVKRVHGNVVTVVTSRGQLYIVKNDKLFNPINMY